MSTTSTATLTSPKAEMKPPQAAAPEPRPPARQTSSGNSGLRRQQSTSAVSNATSHSNHSHTQTSHHHHSTHHGHHVSHSHSHHPKRRQSSHSHIHHTHAGHGKSSGTRRGSEGEGARRALVAGLHMATMEAAKTRNRDRPPTKASKSDTNLPRLSRQVSNASHTSHTSHTSHRSTSKTRPNAANKRQQSGESVELDDQGREVGQADEEDEDWESGEEVEPSRGSKGRDKPVTSIDNDPMTAAMRRTVSDTAATGNTSRTLSITEMPAMVTSPEPLAEDRSGEARPNPTRKMTGFAGPQLPTEPGVATPTHALNDPTHIMPLHQIQHQQSRRSLAAQNAAEESRRAAEARQDSESSAAPMNDGRAEVEREDSTESMLHIKKGRGVAPVGPSRTASDDPRLPDTQEAAQQPADPSTSPRFPFPKMVNGAEGSQQQSPTSPRAKGPQAQVQAQASRSRQASGNGPRSAHPVLAHRPSFSSVRSVQSLRAPPHPLNSPSTQRYAQHSGSGYGTGHASPARDRRGPGMHHPPMAPPVISREAATGSGWIGGGGSDETSPTSPVSTRTLSRADGEQRRRPEGAPSGSGQIPRNSSFSSIQSLRSLRGIFMPASGNAANASTSLSHSTSTAPRPSTPTRRKTALETISAASKMQSTSDPVAYHASLGHSTATAETAHLISRFLPPKKVKRPVWEVPSTVTPEGELCIGLTNGDYREAHESLIRAMRTLGGPHFDHHYHPSSHSSHSHSGTQQSRPVTPGLTALAQVAPGTAARRALNRTSSYGYTNGLLGMSTSSLNSTSSSAAGSGEDGAAAAVGGFKGKRGEMVVLKGGWNGKTAFELSVERCLAQRPQRGVAGF